MAGLGMARKQSAEGWSRSEEEGYRGEWQRQTMQPPRDFWCLPTAPT